MKRVMIVGGPGSGKSTLAVKLGAATGLPVYHMDHIHYKPGWVEREKDLKSALTHKVHAKDQWIFEGGHSSTYQQRLARADTFIWLDFPVWLRTYRVLRRAITHYGRNRPDLPEGCPEQFNANTIDFLRFIWRTRNTSRQRLKDIYDNPAPHLKTYHLNSLSQVNRFVQTHSPANANAIKSGQ